MTGDNIAYYPSADYVQRADKLVRFLKQLVHGLRSV